MYEQQRRPRDLAPVFMFFFRAALVGLFVVIAGRLYQLQVREGPQYQAQADENRFQIIEEAAPRGVIYDRNGNILALNKPSFEIALVPADIPEDDPETPADEEADEMLRRQAVRDAVDKLPERERMVIELRFGFSGDEGPVSLEECGRRLGITRERVRQLEQQALMRLADSGDLAQSA